MQMCLPFPLWFFYTPNLLSLALSSPQIPRGSLLIVPQYLLDHLQLSTPSPMIIFAQLSYPSLPLFLKRLLALVVSSTEPHLISPLPDSASPTPIFTFLYHVVLDTLLSSPTIEFSSIPTTPFFFLHAFPYAKIILFLCHVGVPSQA